MTEQDAEDAALALEELLKSSTRNRELAEAIDVRIAAENKRVEECNQSLRDAKRAIDRLQEAADVSNLDDLRTAISRSDTLRTLQNEISSILKTILEDGDGLTIAELEHECSSVSLDHVVAQERTVTQELEDLNEALMAAREGRDKARREFDAIGGGDRAAIAAADRQAALAELRKIAEEYLRIRSAALLLHWAIERYRREKQAPLLKRASELFAALTNNSFCELLVEFDEHDKMQLAGIRPSGESVLVSGMSTGTADQLSLALRIAAVEDCLDESAPLPFIADDLFVNFDDERAAAAFRVLSQLAQKTQVLFFTHHQHLLDVANTALAATVSTIVLTPHPAVSYDAK